MARLHLDDLLDNQEIAATMDPGLEGTLRRLRAAAEEEDQPQTDQFEAFIVTVAPNGDVSVDVSGPSAFGDWVWAAGDLAHHVGPKTGYVNGELKRVADILGGPEAVADEPVPLGTVGAAPPPIATQPTGMPQLSTVTPVLVFLCTACGQLLDAAPAGHRCVCGGPVENREAVRCSGCATLLLLARAARVSPSPEV